MYLETRGTWLVSDLSPIALWFTLESAWQRIVALSYVNMQIQEGVFIAISLGPRTEPVIVLM